MFKITSKVPYKTVLKGDVTWASFILECLWTIQTCKFHVETLFVDSIVLHSAHSAIVLKAESVADKVEWTNKIRNVIQPSRGGQTRGAPPEGGLTLRQSLSDGSLVCH